MSLLETLRNAKILHAYVAVVALAVAFNIFGMIGQVQALGVILFSGFAAVIDAVSDLSRSIDQVDSSIESVDSQLAQVTSQLTRVNDNGEDRDRDRDRDQASDSPHNRDPDR